MFDNELVLHFDTIPFKQDERVVSLSEQGYRVLQFDLFNDSKPAIDWDLVAMAFVAVRPENFAICTRRIRQLAQHTRVIAVTNGPPDSLSDHVHQLDAVAVFDPNTQAQQFLYAVENTVWLRGVRQQRRLMPDYARRLAKLTPRQRRIIQLAADGETNKRIARLMNLSVNSIERIRREAYRCLDVSSPAEMTRVVILGGMYQSESSAPTAHKRTVIERRFQIPNSTDLDPTSGEAPLSTASERHALVKKK